MKVKIAPSILASDFSRLGEEVQAVEKAGADMIHADIMDGHFVPNITIGPQVVAAIRPHTTLPISVHLMISEPKKYAERFIKSGADAITVHVEVVDDVPETIRWLKSMGVKAGLSLNPDVSVEKVFPYISIVDHILIMSVFAGFGGQKFIPESLERIRQTRERADNDNPDLDIEIDGGIYPSNAAEIVRAGANVLIAGTAIFGSDDMKKAIKGLRTIENG